MFCSMEQHGDSKFQTSCSSFLTRYLSFTVCPKFKVITAEIPLIRKTGPCNEYPLEPHFYMAKLGFAEVYIFFSFLFQNIDCGYTLEPHRRGGSNEYP